MNLTELLAAVAAGRTLPADGTVDVVRPTRPQESAVLAFTGRSVVVTELDPAWVHEQLPADDLSAPLCPPFLTALTERLGRCVGGIDLVAVAEPAVGPPVPALHPIDRRDHPRVRRALQYRQDLQVWGAEGGVLVLGRGLGGRLEVSVEVEPAHRARGLGRRLAAAARALADEPVWAQIAPGNAASVRAFLAAGFTPVGAEALLVPGEQAGQTNANSYRPG